MRAPSLAIFLCAVACSRAGSPTGADLAVPSNNVYDAALVSADAGEDFAPQPDMAGAWRNTLSDCWLDATCTRALVIAHGGAWVLVSPPYGTSAAFEDAYSDDADAIKADLRYSKDNVAVVVHSSPFASYEIDPLDFSCLGATVENMNVSDIVACQWVNGDHIQRLDQLLSWASGKLVVMLTVKNLTQLPQAIETLIALGATHRAFLEIDTTSMLNVVPTAPDSDQVYYLVEAASQTDVLSLLAQHNARAFMYEDANSDNFGGMAASAVTTMIQTQLHPAGVRAFTSVTGVTASALDHENLWNQGFDVVMTNSYAAGEQGRVAVNTARGISPP
jgi:glycerophosphoryl diester phosphodiesterase